MRQNFTIKEYIILFFMSISLAVGLNNILFFLKLSEYSEAYREAVKVLYAPGLLEQIFVTCILVPIVEEWIFRGFIFKIFRKRLPFAVAMVISAVLFGIYHGNLVQFVYATLCGLVLAYLYEHFQSMIIPIAAHMVMNLVVVLFTEYGIFTWILSDAYRGVMLTLLCVAEFIFSVICFKKSQIQ